MKTEFVPMLGLGHKARIAQAGAWVQNKTPGCIQILSLQLLHKRPMSEPRGYNDIDNSSSGNDLDDSEWEDYSNPEWVDFYNSSENELDVLSEEDDVSVFEDMSESMQSPPSPRKHPEDWQKHHAPFPHNPYIKEKPQQPFYEPPLDCVVCRARKDFVGYRPCRHVLVCTECTKKLTRCPMCLRTIDRAEIYVKQKLK